jgi:hypothetical protein
VQLLDPLPLVHAEQPCCCWLPCRVHAYIDYSTSSCCTLALEVTPSWPKQQASAATSSSLTRCAMPVTLMMRAHTAVHNLCKHALSLTSHASAHRLSPHHSFFVWKPTQRTVLRIWCTSTPKIALDEHLPARRPNLGVLSLAPLFADSLPASILRSACVLSVTRSAATCAMETSCILKP